MSPQSDNSTLWIDLPAATFGLALGVAFNHGVESIQATLATPDALVAGLILQRSGEVVPNLAIAHLDDPLVITATVVAMRRAMNPGVLMGILSPIESCRSFAISSDPSKCNLFFHAARQTFWGDHVDCQRIVSPPTEPGSPHIVLYDLRQNRVLLPTTSLPERDELIPSFDNAARIFEHQTRLCGEICPTSRKRRQLAGTSYVDTGCDNFTGADYARMPFQLFNLQNATLKGYDVG